MVWQSARRLEEGGIQWLGHRLDARCGIAPICDSSPPTTMRSTANCSARRTAAGGGQAVDVLRAVQASICDSIRKQYAACSAVKVCCHAPSCFGRQWSRDPGRATRLVTAHHLFAATGTLSPRNTRAPAPLEPPLRRPLALEAPRDPSSLDPRSATAQHGAATALQAGEHAVCPSLTGAWRHGTDMEK
jgi:hypothetical protein